MQAWQKVKKNHCALPIQISDLGHKSPSGTDVRLSVATLIPLLFVVQLKFFLTKAIMK